jgi:acyl-CoA synthetase (NDP forming)
MPKPALDYLFNPRSIAIAGVSPDAAKPNLAQFFVETLRNFGFKGEIYPLHPSGGEIFGSRVYKRVTDIAGPVDYVVSAIPARFTPGLIEDCGKKGVRAVHLFTSGYAEIEDEIGKQLEDRVLAIARSAGVRLVGPNCMGIYCPSAGLTFAGEFQGQRGFPAKSGSLGLISQSGGNCIFCVREAASRGIFFSKAISYGNAVDLNESDYLEYMAEDPDTSVIAMYIEGVRDGERFLRVLKQAAAVKPVIINKAGNTETGARACSSHTSAIAGSAWVWRDLIRQAGAIQVDTMSELIDVAVAFQKMPELPGKNVVLIGTGGGVGVQAADDVTAAGLEVPLLPEKVRKSINGIYGTEAGSMFRNPVDIPPFGKVAAHVEAIRCMERSEQVDIMIIHYPFDLWALVDRALPLKPFVEVVKELAKSPKKPLAAVLHYAVSPEARRLMDQVQAEFVEIGLPVYPSVSRAAAAISRRIEYNGRAAGRNRPSK